MQIGDSKIFDELFLPLIGPDITIKRCGQIARQKSDRSSFPDTPEGSRGVKHNRLKGKDEADLVEKEALV